MIKKVSFFKKWFFRLYWLVDILLLFLIYSSVEGNVQFVFLALLILLLFYNALTLYRYFKGKVDAKTNATNYRVQAFSGPQGIGKSSFALNIIKLLKPKDNFYSNLPSVINGNVCNVLTKNALAMRTRLDNGSIIFLDEMSLYFNNLDQTCKREEIAAIEANMQLVRHNFNGYIFASSVVMDRLLAVLEEKFGLENMILEQRSIKTGFVVPFVYSIIRKIQNKIVINKYTKLINLEKDVNKKDILIKKMEQEKYPFIYWGVRRWKVQTFLSINKDNYVYDLSTDNANTRQNKFVNLYYYYTFNDGSVIYDDRFLSELYKKLPAEPKLKFKSLKYDFDLVKYSGFDSIDNLYEKVLSNAINCNSAQVPVTARKGGNGKRKASKVKNLDLTILEK